MREQYYFAKHVYERALDNTFVYRITYFRVGHPLLSYESPPPMENDPSSGNRESPPVEIKTHAVEIRVDPASGNW